MVDDVVFASDSDEWETPPALFDKLDKEFHFTLDPCASDENHKCDLYYTIETDGWLRTGHRTWSG